MYMTNTTVYEIDTSNEKDMEVYNQLKSAWQKDWQFLEKGSIYYVIMRDRREVKWSNEE